MQDLRQIKSRSGTYYGFWSNGCFFFISRHYIWHISCIFSRCIAFIALRWIDLTRLVLSSIIFKLLISTIDCLGQNILLAADWLPWTRALNPGPEHLRLFVKYYFLTISTRFCQAYSIVQQKYVSEDLKTDTHEEFCSRSMLQGDAPGAKLLRVYHRFHGYTSSSGAEFPPRKMLHDN